MIYLKTTDPQNGATSENLLYCWGDVFRATFNPDIHETAVIIEFKIHGKTYAERQNCLHDIAVKFQTACTGDLYYSEIEKIVDWFETNGKRYGLMHELRENAII